MSKKKVEVSLRLPRDQIEWLHRVAEVAKVKPEVVFNVVIAQVIVQTERGTK